MEQAQQQKKTVAILGATGMLGSALYAELKDKYRLILVVRDPAKVALLEKAHGTAPDARTVAFDIAKLHDDFVAKKGHTSEYRAAFFDAIQDADYVINAVGVTIPYSLENQAGTFFINSFFPHLLAAHLGPKLIHITTDCVYNGIDGFPYDEHSPKTPVDLYGLSKSLGEPTNALTIRTSIIGRELEGFTGLLEWFLQQNGKTLKGFTNHFWNGITTKQFAKVCDAVMSDPEQYPKTGIYHVFTNPVSKYEMLLAFKKRFNIDCEIVPDDQAKLNRTMGTVHAFNKALNIPSFEEMVREI